MSMLVMAQPTPHAAFSREFLWDDGRPSDFISSRPRSDPERIALPSIRQAIPEIQLPIQPHEGPARTPSSSTPPLAGIRSTTSPEYVHSPNSNKRRRLSIDENRESERVGRVPRLYTSPSSSTQRQSPGLAPRSADRWVNSTRTSPYMPRPSSARSPVMIENAERIEQQRTGLPSLPIMPYEQRAAQDPRVHGYSMDEYAHEPPRPVMAHHNAAPNMDAAYGQGGHYGTYSQHHPSHMQSVSLGSAHPFDRSPFSAVAAAASYGAHYHDYIRIGELGGLGMGGDNKQRKRRGNLPKETTDKLRTWFIGHLHHPYPTEDEKQELMRQTGLQMNQISNWFINARRRQLPTMINNARVESDAMSGRNADGKVIPSTERAEYDDLGRKSSLSDGEGSPFEDDYDSIKRRGPANMKHGSV